MGTRQHLGSPDGPCRAASPRLAGRGGAAFYLRLRDGVVLRRRIGTAFRQAADCCAVGLGGKVYEIDPGVFRFLKACDGRASLAALRRRFPGCLEADAPPGRIAREIAADPTLADLVEARPSPTPADPRQAVETRGLVAACRVAVWHLVEACNLSCVHCYLGDDPRGKPFDERTAMATVRNLHAVGVEGVRLSGGEVTLRPRLLAATGAALARWCLPFSINSNGTTDLSCIEELFAAHPAYARFVQVSLDGAEAGHDAFRRKPGAFRRSLAGVRRLASRGVPVCVVSMMHRGWLGRERELFDLLSGSGIYHWSVELPVRAGRWKRRPGGLSLSGPEVEAMSLRLIRLLDRGPMPWRVFEINQVYRRPPEADEIQKTPRSPVCMHHLGLLTLGERGLSFCSIFADAFGPGLTDLAPAHSSRASFLKAWNAIARARVGTRIADNPACRRCRLLRACQGGCPGHYADPASFSGCDEHARLLAEVRLSVEAALAGRG